MIKTKNILNFINRNFKAFPITTLYVLIWTILSFFPEDDSLLILFFGVAFGIFFSAFIHSFIHYQEPRKSVRTFLLALALFLPPLIYCSLSFQDYGEDFTIFLITATLCLSSFLGLFWAPFFPLHKTSKDLWDYSLKILIYTLLTVFFGVIMFLGFLLLTFAIETLFDLNFGDTVIFHIFLLILGTFGPLFCLNRISNISAQKENPGKMYTIFVQFILTPILLIFGLILYTYFFKIILTQEIPKNVLGALIFIFLGLSFFTYLALTPFVSKQPVSYQRIFWMLLLLPNLVLFYSISLRISEYGLTVPRYMFVALSIWSFFTILSFVKKPNHKFILPLVIFSVLLPLTQIGPFNAHQVTLSSQQKALQELLLSPEKNQDAIRSKVQFISYEYPTKGFSPWIEVTRDENPWEQKNKAQEQMLEHIEKTTGIDFKLQDPQIYR